MWSAQHPFQEAIRGRGRSSDYVQAMLVVIAARIQWLPSPGVLLYLVSLARVVRACVPRGVLADLASPMANS